MSVKVKINLSGLRSLLTSSEVEDYLLGRAEAIANRANANSMADSGDAYLPMLSMERPSRARAVVVTSNWDAMYDEAKNKTLTKAIDAGRG